MIDPATNLFTNLIIDWCGYKIILKLDNWSMRIQNYFETRKLIEAGTKSLWDLIIDRYTYKIILKLDYWSMELKLFSNLTMDWCGYKIIFKLNNCLIFKLNNSWVWVQKLFWNLKIDWCGYRIILESWYFILACTKLIRNLIIDGCGHKMIFKLDHWPMWVQNDFETW